MAFGLVSKTSAGSGMRRWSNPSGDTGGRSRRPGVFRQRIQQQKSSNLLELELGAMIRSSNRAANSVAGGPRPRPATLSTIRQRTDALIRAHQRRASTATIFSQAADKFTHSAEGIGSQVRRRRQARRPGPPQHPMPPAKPASASDRWKESLGRHRQCRQPDRPDARQTTLRRSNSPSRRRWPERRARLRGVANEVKALGGADPNATEEITKKIDALQKDAAVRSMPCSGFRRRSKRSARCSKTFNGAVAGTERNTGEMSGQRRTRVAFHRLGRRQRRWNIAARPRRRGSWRSVASAGKAVTMFAQKLTSRCRCCCIRTRQRPAQARTAAVQLRIEIATARGPITAAVYANFMEGILISGAGAERLPLHETVNATLENVGPLPGPPQRAFQGRRAGAVRGRRMPNCARRSKTGCGRSTTKTPNSSPAPWKRHRA